MDTINCIENAFATLAECKVVMPPIFSMGIHEFNGEVDVKTAYVPGVKSFAIKMSPWVLFDNPKLDPHLALWFCSLKNGSTRSTY